MPASLLRLLSVPLLLLTALLGACQTRPSEELSTGAAAYDRFPAQAAPSEAYRIGAFDRLTISVYNQPSLSFTDIPVDAEGEFQFPLIGTISAEGKTAGELRSELKARLDSEFYRDSQVTVLVNTSSRQTVVVEGSVTEPGRYELPNGKSNLLEVIALAKSPTRTAALDEVMVFRTVDGQRYGALFNLADIRVGRADNPAIQSGDVIVVGFSELKGAFRDFLQAAPLINVFRVF